MVVERRFENFEKKRLIIIGFLSALLFSPIAYAKIGCQHLRIWRHFNEECAFSHNSNKCGIVDNTLSAKTMKKSDADFLLPFSFSISFNYGLSRGKV